MRISTATAFRAPVESMIRQQAEIERTQQEISSGKKLRSLAENPAQAAQVSDLDRYLAAAERYSRNADIAAGRLRMGELTVTSSVDLLQRARELAIAATNDGLDASARRAIAEEVRGLGEQLLVLANRRYENGEYMFAGAQTDTIPFTRTASGPVAYVGDSREREVPISASRVIADGFAGDDIFNDIVAANGAFRTAPAGSNTGTAIVGVGSVTDGVAWSAAVAPSASPAGYTLRFSVGSTGTTYEVFTAVGSSLTPPITGSYRSGQSIGFLGIQVPIQGMPAHGDEFTVTPALGQTESVFDTLDRLVAALETPDLTSSTRARVTSEFGSIVHQFDQAIENLSDVRSSIAARLQIIDENESFREEQELSIKESLSGLRDVDFAEALARLNAQMTALQVAQQAYARVSNRSLFDYL